MADSSVAKGPYLSESQQLIDSIFSGRLSISSNSGRPSTTLNHHSMSPTTHGLSRKESTIKSKLKLGSSWTHQQHQQQQVPSTPTLSSSTAQPQQAASEVAGTEHHHAASERDASKMRKPSFWSIFRGGSSQRKEAEEK
ncbi:hypothetical protein LPJ56_003031, partial [Coemansia sp. RSA 2599]